jgi:hypothetical protein
MNSGPGCQKVKLRVNDEINSGKSRSQPGAPL